VVNLGISFSSYIAFKYPDSLIARNCPSKLLSGNPKQYDLAGRFASLQACFRQSEKVILRFLNKFQARVKMFDFMIT
jgi:hypothetical protein